MEYFSLASSLETVKIEKTRKYSDDLYDLALMTAGQKMARGGKHFVCYEGKVCEVKKTPRVTILDDTNPITYEEFCELEESPEERIENREARKYDYFSHNRRYTKEEIIKDWKNVAFHKVNREYHMIARTEKELSKFDEDKAKEKAAFLNLLEMQGRIHSVLR